MSKEIITGEDIANLTTALAKAQDEIEQLTADRDRYIIAHTTEQNRRSMVEDDHDTAMAEVERLQAELSEMTSAHSIRCDEVNGLTGMLKEARAECDSAIERERVTKLQRDDARKALAVAGQERSNSFAAQEVASRALVEQAELAAIGDRLFAMWNELADATGAGRHLSTTVAIHKAALRWIVESARLRAHAAGIGEMVKRWEAESNAILATCKFDNTPKDSEQITYANTLAERAAELKAILSRLDMAALLAGGEAEASCQHEWIDARNEVIVSGEICKLCCAMRTGNQAGDGAVGGEAKDEG